MTQSIKNYLGIAIIVVLLVLAYVGVMYVQTYAKSIQPSSYRSFAVSGEGRVVTVPDIAQFTFSVITQGGKELSNLQKDNTTKVNAIIDFVKKQGIDKQDIKTQGYNIDPRYENYACVAGGPCPPPQIVGYNISQMVLVKIRNFEKISTLLGGVVDKGANSVSQLTFTLDDPSAKQNEARLEAIKKAQSKAVAIAKASGFRLGRLLGIDEGGNYPQPIYARSDIGMMAKEVSLPAPTIEPGSQEVTINVTLRYEIE